VPWVRLPDGTAVHIKMPRPRTYRCKTEGCDELAPYLCDHREPGAKRDCNRRCCPGHALLVGPNRHLCPLHHPAQEPPMTSRIVELLTRARKLAVSPTALQLLALIDDLLALEELVGEMLEAQQRYFALARSTKATEAERGRALERARKLEERVQAERQRLGLARQQGLPGMK